MWHLWHGMLKKMPTTCPHLWLHPAASGGAWAHAKVLDPCKVVRKKFGHRCHKARGPPRTCPQHTLNAPNGPQRFWHVRLEQVPSSGQCPWVCSGQCWGHVLGCHCMGAAACLCPGFGMHVLAGPKPACHWNGVQVWAAGLRWAPSAAGHGPCT